MINFYLQKTVKWENGKVVLIDQTKLPNKVSFIECNDYKQVAIAIKNLAVRGAPALATTAALGLALAAKNSKAENKEELLRELEVASKIIGDTRPTAINLFWAIQRIMGRAKSFKGNVKKMAEAVLEDAICIAEEDIAVNHKLGKIGAEMLNHGDIVLTHCK